MGVKGTAYSSFGINLESISIDAGPNAFVGTGESIKISGLTQPAVGIAAELDGGTSDPVPVTQSPAVSGSLTNWPQGDTFLAGFDATPSGNYVNETSAVSFYGTIGYFYFSAAQLQQIYGGALPDSAHVLHFLVNNAAGSPVASASVSFILHTTPRRSCRSDWIRLSTRRLWAMERRCSVRSALIGQTARYRSGNHGAGNT